MKVRSAYIVLITLALASCVPSRSTGSPASESVVDSSGGPGRVEVIGGDEEALRDFIGRYINPGFPGAPGGTTQVFIGTLPTDLSFDMPLPDNARVVASVVHPEPLEATEILLDVDLPPDEVIALYDDELTGWHTIEFPGPRGAFVSQLFVSQPIERAHFCQDEGDTTLILMAWESESGRTDVRLDIVPTDEYSFCAQQDFTDPEDPDLIPALVAPEGVIMGLGLSGGGSSGSDQYISATLESELSADELAIHYASQLEEAEWQLVEDGSSGSSAWSTWLLSDDDGDEWAGVLIVLEDTGVPGNRFTWVRIERMP